MSNAPMNPEFQFFRPRSREGALALSAPDAVLRFDGPAEGYECRGFDPGSPGDPYTAVDRFMERFQTGVVAGWLAYELGAWNHDLPPPDPDLSAAPLLLLAHYPEVEPALPDPPGPSGSFELSDFEPVVGDASYRGAIRSIKRSIREGYVYQVNLSRRYRARIRGEIRPELARLSPDRLPPHSVYTRLGSLEILSLSPERFLRVEEGRVLTQPIKGTRPRAPEPSSDRANISSLLASSKDRAEHAMIVDLERNDLNRICVPGSVHVPEFCKLRSFPTVHHLVSTVAGRIREDLGPGEIFRRIFPGGSITGAPKSTALRLIDRFEARNRGIYTGCIGFWDRDHNTADWNIAIRTLVRRGAEAWWDAGGGIVIDSDPGAECEESLDKVELIRRLGRGLRNDPEPTLGGWSRG